MQMTHLAFNFIIHRIIRPKSLATRSLLSIGPPLLAYYIINSARYAKTSNA
jgi:hypothetical protein